MKIHETYIKRCIQLAKNGLPAAMPNPSVGAVIVHEGIIIGEGNTSAYGGPHAEVNAIAFAKAHYPELVAKATLYVSLEPCSHYGKTPPCADLIIESGLKKIVIGTIDPHSKVAGGGIKKLMEANCDVVLGILEEECRLSNKRFFCFHQKKRPYIILKWAESSDGFIAPSTKKKQAPVWITNAQSRQLVHKWRSEEQAILVGANTVLADNPSLTTRDWEGTSPIRIVLDERANLPKEAAVFNELATTLTLAFSDPEMICKALFEKKIQSVIIEGGTKTIQSFIAANLWDEARIFEGKLLFEEGTKAPVINSTFTAYAKEQLNEDQLSYYKNNQL